MLTFSFSLICFSFLSKVFCFFFIHTCVCNGLGCYVTYAILIWANFLRCCKVVLSYTFVEDIWVSKDKYDEDRFANMKDFTCVTTQMQALENEHPPSILWHNMPINVWLTYKIEGWHRKWGLLLSVFLYLVQLDYLQCRKANLFKSMKLSMLKKTMWIFLSTNNKDCNWIISNRFKKGLILNQNVCKCKQLILKLEGLDKFLEARVFI